MSLVLDGTRPIVCLGDSITASGWPEVLQEILRTHGYPAARCLNAGIRGNTSTQGLQRLERDVLRHAPGLVFVEFGLNDCNIILNAPRPRTDPVAFRSNVTTIIQKIQQAEAQVVLIANHRTLLTRPQPGGSAYEERSQQYSAITAAVAAANSVPLLDLRDRFPGPGLRLEEVLDEDGIHLNTAGIEVYAALAAGMFLAEPGRRSTELSN